MITLQPQTDQLFVPWDVHMYSFVKAAAACSVLALKGYAQILQSGLLNANVKERRENSNWASNVLCRLCAAAQFHLVLQVHVPYGEADLLLSAHLAEFPLFESPTVLGLESYLWLGLSRDERSFVHLFLSTASLDSTLMLLFCGARRQLSLLNWGLRL
jgi:hypothetical protein